MTKAEGKVTKFEASKKKADTKLEKFKADNERLKGELAVLKGELAELQGAANDVGRSNGTRGRAKDPHLELDLYQRKKEIDLQHKLDVADIDDQTKNNASIRKKQDKRKKGKEVANTMRLMTRVGGVRNGMFDAEGMMGLVSSFVHSIYCSFFRCQ